jgi:hypothetical protein
LVVERVTSAAVGPDQELSLALPAASSASLSPLTSAGAWSFAWEPQRLPPPTDLVVVLRHFVI